MNNNIIYNIHKYIIYIILLIYLSKIQYSIFIRAYTQLPINTYGYPCWLGSFNLHCWLSLWLS